ncbi:MAG TPA: efflux RND transporter periplasmic adaptor subunit [bacterium]|nr:efflux RND transporter periplasmic adaptor subunit [bacterium]HPJ71158.1 efflux RND transporter periplasmic adaptor subunit [bacterium]HPQ66035.1 efflux RND transporter periplasmic adaptor subunit [bacterium]
MRSNAETASSRGARLRTWAVALVLLAGATVASWRLIVTKPRPQVRPPTERVFLVDTVALEPGEETVFVRSSGTVIPALAVDLQARVTGELVEINPSFQPGGRLRKGETAARIDPRDYGLAVERARADVVRAEEEYRMEQGRQDIARHEWSLLGEGTETTELDRELALRQPQLRQAEASLSAARASLRQAELDLERTDVTAPFNCVVLERDADPGSQVSTQTVLGRLAGTDEFWVTLQLAVGDLAWVEVGDRVELTPAGLESTGMKWEGSVIRKQADLEKEGRLARVLVSVPEPLEDPGRRLLLGMYVRARIHGRTLEGIYAVPRPALRGSDSVWLVGSDGRLDIRPVEVIWAGPERALIRGEIDPGALMVVSDLASPVAGMLLKNNIPSPGAAR